ncbi:hypothetical protein PG994_002929 [Apiospora phragmitis]|uniref:Secreted protein n=1 Tax=Apiospora phragmitis TaxID=2905665 RepID=A0ABR1W6T6_9PEZI
MSTRTSKTAATSPLCLLSVLSRFSEITVPKKTKDTVEAEDDVEDDGGRHNGTQEEQQEGHQATSGAPRPGLDPGEASVAS